MLSDVAAVAIIRARHGHQRMAAMRAARCHGASVPSAWSWVAIITFFPALLALFFTDLRDALTILPKRHLSVEFPFSNSSLSFARPPLPLTTLF